jgi:hypothetical protein
LERGTHTGGEIGAAIDEGVRRGYEEGYLRKSIVRSPIDRTNTGDNTPAVVYYEPVSGDGLKLTMLVKGAGCDNMSALKMLTPADGLPAMKEFVVGTIERAGPNASPPLTVGVGIGGPFEKAAQLAKKALTRPSGEPNPDPELATLEAELLDAINATGIGPAGYGGTQTALAVHVESFPTHIAAFPCRRQPRLPLPPHRLRRTVSPEPVRLSTPLSMEDIESLRTGHVVRLDGVIFTARDAAHAKMKVAIERDEPLPFDPEGQIVYFTGPAPARPGHALGPAGPLRHRVWTRTRHF